MPIAHFAVLTLGCAALTAVEPIAWDTFPIVDEVRPGVAEPGYHFTDLPAGSSAIATRDGIAYRTLPNHGDGKAFAIRIGEGKGLEASATYVLEIDYAEDAPRSFFILNRGDSTYRGITCGPSLQDSLYQYTATNPEVLDLPLAGGVQTWRSVFRLHDLTRGIAPKRGENNYTLQPKDGFWVLIAQPEARRFPGSEGAAIAAIRIRAIAQPERLHLTPKRPPADLPQRHIFWREEMSDGIVSDLDEAKRGRKDPIAWYEDKVATMRLLGFDTFGKDLLEFGHNQGWDSNPYGGNDWVYQTKYPDRWAKIVALMGREKISILPYYEYAGSVGAKSLGRQKRAKPLNGKADYTHISWSEKTNADLTDPDTLEDFRKIVDLTVLRLHDQADFLGVWLRPRPAANPIGFGPETIARFVADTGTQATIERLRSDDTLREAYYAWWNGKRRDFLTGVRDILHQGGVEDATVFYTAYSGEPTPSFHKDNVIVEGDTARWRDLLSSGDHKRTVVPFSEAVADQAYLKTILAFPGTWGGWEWHHAAPPADPATYSDVPGVVMTYPYNRSYTVADPTAMEAFRTPSGLAMLRHQPLNEDVVLPKGMIGYHCVDMELAGPACVLQEVQAVANGDPRWLGTLNGMSLTRGFPEYVRAFNSAFLALPALPSTVLENVNAENVVIRVIDGGPKGQWFAACNTGYTTAKVTVKLPGRGRLTNAVSGDAITERSGSVTLELPPCSLTALQRKP